MLNIVQYTGAGYLWLSAKHIKKPVRSKQACIIIVNITVNWVLSLLHTLPKRKCPVVKNRKIRKLKKLLC